MSFYITKASGDKELFDIQKFTRSLQRVGATPDAIERIARDLEKLPTPNSTHEIYQYALNRLQQQSPHLAARYNLKQALFQLGPTGFPFEQFIGELFRAKKFSVKTDQIVSGWCVEHEIDVIASTQAKQIMVECKFHAGAALKVDVKVPLYIKARFDDVHKAWDSKQGAQNVFHEAWIVTNTRFTTPAVQYAKCAGIQLLGWSYPLHENLQMLIDHLGLHPITAFPSLSLQQKKDLVHGGFVLCRDARQHQTLLHRLGFSQQEIDTLVKESELLCAV